MPFPSAGCQTCKLRRIKCDEAQPVCQRCVKAQRICRPTTAVAGGQSCSVIHLENSYASGAKKRPRGPRSTPTAEIELTTAGNLVLDAVDLLQLQKQRPLFDLKTQAIVYYVRHHLQTLNDTQSVSKGVSDDFVSTWTSSRAEESPILDLAVSSMALVVFSRTQHHPPAAIEASSTYHQLLQIAQSAISSLDQANINACLIAIFFMSRYENVVHVPTRLDAQGRFAKTFQGFSHHDGALAILKVWRDAFSGSHPATNVIKHTRRAMIKSALLRSLTMPEWMLEGSIFGEHGLELEYDRILVQIGSVRHRLSTLLKEKKKTIDDPSQRTFHEQLTSTAEYLHKEARDIDQALQDWTAHFPSTWCYQRHTLPSPLPLPTRDFYSQIVYSYSSPAYAAVWNQYYSARMLINSTCLRVLDEVSPPPNSDEYAAHEQQRSECLSHVETMANDLASSVPFCLERFKVTNNSQPFPNQKSITLNTNEVLKPYVASMAIWPMTIASCIEDVDVEQRLWFRSVLARQGRMMGDRVLECVDHDQFFNL